MHPPIRKPRVACLVCYLSSDLSYLSFVFLVVITSVCFSIFLSLVPAVQPDGHGVGFPE